MSSLVNTFDDRGGSWKIEAELGSDKWISCREAEGSVREENENYTDFLVVLIFVLKTKFQEG